MPEHPRVLIGGVPFGRNNVGDEAILECVVAIVRELCPSAMVSVSTDDGAVTAARLGVRTVPLFGFEPPYSREEMRRELAAHDVFLWAGATGLSDYPAVPTTMLGLAQAAGRRTVVWNVGMNHELNPVFYRLQPGRRRSALRLLSGLTLNRFDAVAWTEHRRQTQARRMIAERLAAADLVVVRDPESKVEIAKCAPPSPEVMVGADSALQLQPAAWESLHLPDAVLALLAASGPKVGVCISAQREVRNRRGLLEFLNGVTGELGARVLFIPMNPVTDAALMVGLRQEMAQPGRAAVLEERYDPGAILAVAGRLNVILSSRLHLLIFASIVHVPIIGISRGSKVDNFLAPFGLRAAGSVDDCDFTAVLAETARLLAGQDAFATTSRRVRAELLARLAAAKERLRAVLVLPPMGRHEKQPRTQL